MHHIEVDTEPESTIVSATGELDAYAAPDLTSAFDSPPGDGSVIVDLTAVSFMDSTALGVLVRAVRVLGDAGCEVRVVLPRSAARRIFEITTLDRVLPIAESRSNALAELSPTA